MSQQQLSGVTYIPSTGVRAIFIEAEGAGGGGGGVVASAAGQGTVAGGGGGGAYANKFIIVPKTTYTIAIGVPGTAGANTGGTGGTGGDTSFDTAPGPATVVAKGGLGGVGNATSTATAIAILGGAGGPAATCVGDVKVDGTAGQPGVKQTTAGLGFVSGSGGQGCGPLGGGGGIARIATGPGSAGGNYGGGGSGAASIISGAAQVGGVGGPGAIWVTEYA